jgi:thymidylate kinase
MRKFPNLFIVSVTGTIAAGKTTLINALKEERPLSLLQTREQQKVVFIPETHTIQGTRSYELAPAYFASNTLTDAVEREKINLDFQLSVLTDLHDLLSAENEKAKDDPALVILERSWMDVLVFAPIALPNPRELQILKDQIGVLFGECADYTVYLEINPYYALQRARDRAKKKGGDKQSVDKFGNIKLFQQIDARYALMISEIPKERFLCVSPTHAEQTNKIACQIISNQQLLTN